LAFLPGLAFFRHGLAFFLKRCLATLSSVYFKHLKNSNFLGEFHSFKQISAENLRDGF